MHCFKLNIYRAFILNSELHWIFRSMVLNSVCWPSNIFHIFVDSDFFTLTIYWSFGFQLACVQSSHWQTTILQRYIDSEFFSFFFLMTYWNKTTEVVGSLACNVLFFSWLVDPLFSTMSMFAYMKSSFPSCPV